MCHSIWTKQSLLQVGDFIDMHNYVGPGSPLPTSSRAAVLGEFGGLGLRVDGHRFVPQEDFCYELQGNSAQLEVRDLSLQLTGQSDTAPLVMWGLFLVTCNLLCPVRRMTASCH